MYAPQRREPLRLPNDAPLAPLALHRRRSMELARVRRRFTASIAIAAVAMTIAVLVADRLT